MARIMFMATVQVLVNVETKEEASLIISNCFFEAQDIEDWGYLQVGGQGLTPTAKMVSNESDFMKD